VGDCAVSERHEELFGRSGKLAVEHDRAEVLRRQPAKYRSTQTQRLIIIIIIIITTTIIYSAVIYGAIAICESSLWFLWAKAVSARWPPTRRPSCKLDL